MRHSIWMNAWDVDGRDPAELIGELRDCGFDGCRLGLCYHGGRLLLGRHPRRVVYEQMPGAVYFPAAFRGKLRPDVAPEAPAVIRFLEACESNGFPVSAWMVFCHNDALGALHSECCIENAFGEKYSYALCPANPDVQEYILELSGQIAALPAVRSIDAEALSFMGYDHQSLHEKRSVLLTPALVELLSVCHCPYCRGHAGDLGDDIRAILRGRAPSRTELPPALYQHRRRVLCGLLDQLHRYSLDLRYIDDPTFTGGKTAIPWADLKGRVSRATLTFFGHLLESMRESIERWPGKRPVPLAGGFVFHLPDCVLAKDIPARYRLLAEAGVEEISFYCYGLASPVPWAWLRQFLKGVTK